LGHLTRKNRPGGRGLDFLTYIHTCKAYLYRAKNQTVTKRWDLSYKIKPMQTSVI